MHTVVCIYNILLGILHGGCRLDVDVELVFALGRIDEFVLGLKSVDESCHSPPMGIGSADTGQPPKGEICMDKSH
jgi:hypothetical protein